LCPVWSPLLYPVLFPFSHPCWFVVVIPFLWSPFSHPFSFPLSAHTALTSKRPVAHAGPKLMFFNIQLNVFRVLSLFVSIFVSLLISTFVSLFVSLLVASLLVSLFVSLSADKALRSKLPVAHAGPKYLFLKHAFNSNLQLCRDPFRLSFCVPFRIPSRLSVSLFVSLSVSLLVSLFASPFVSIFCPQGVEVKAPRRPLRPDTYFLTRNLQYKSTCVCPFWSPCASLLESLFVSVFASLFVSLFVSLFGPQSFEVKVPSRPRQTEYMRCKRYHHF